MEFTNPIDPAKFRATNAEWNLLCLNDPWSIGYVAELVETKPFQSKEHWEFHYYQLGELRDQFVTAMPADTQQLLNDHTLKQTNPNHIRNLPWDIKNINYRYGRTQAQLAEKGWVLHQRFFHHPLGISLEDCIAAVRFRTICETWNGIVLRERNTVALLTKRYPKAHFIKANSEFDHRYAVDYQVMRQGEVVAGIQIKPPSYLGNAPYLSRAQAGNHRKNSQYQKTFGCPVVYVISKTNGEILNPEALPTLDYLIKY